MAGELRHHKRYVHRGLIRMSWEAQGGPKFTSAKCQDISEFGIQLLVPEPVRVLTTISLRSDQIGFSCSGVVRHCIRCGSKYVVGIEFGSPVRLPVARLEAASARNELPQNGAPAPKTD